MNNLKDKNNHKMVDTPKTLSEIFSYYKISLEYIQKYADKDGRIINY